MNKLLQWRLFLSNERGSASVEFSLLAIPLFIPIFIALNSFGDLSSKEDIARTLARESARSFVASNSDSSGHAVAGEVIRIAGEKLGLRPEEISQTKLEIICNSQPCISPKGKIRATVTIKISGENRIVTASAIEYVSPWI